MPEDILTGFVKMDTATRKDATSASQSTEPALCSSPTMWATPSGESRHSFGECDCVAEQSGWHTWWPCEYGVGDYYVYLPPDKPPDKQFSVDMPQELVKRRTDKKE